MSLASSVWASQKTFASLQYAKIKNVFALSAQPESPNTEKGTSPDLQLQKLPRQTGSHKHEPAPESDNHMPPESTTFKKTPDQPPTKYGSLHRLKLLPVTPPDLGDDIVSAVNAFKRTFAQTWRPAHVPPERGTVMFSGMVELVGPKGVAVFDVRAAYHPAESRWSSIGIAPRRIQPRKQSPRGGS